MSAYGLTRDQNVDLLVKTALEYGITDRRQLAYIVATAQHETDNFATSREYDGPNQAIRRGYGGGENYYGRGYVQVTHDTNYDKMATALGDSRIRTNPDIVAQEANLGAQTTVVGMARGLYTGVGLDRYINSQGADYTDARAIVNDTDKASLIAGYARNWEQQMDTIVDRVSAQGLTPRAMPGSPMADGSLSRGESGPEVARMQEALRQQGFNITPDGIYGGGTQSIVQQYQERNGLPRTGTADPATLEKLGVTQIVPLANTPAQPNPTPTTPTPTTPTPTPAEPTAPTNTTPAPTPTPNNPATPAPTPTTPTAPVNDSITLPTGNGTWPVQGHHRINDVVTGEPEFGKPRNNSAGFHTGVDLEGPRGAAVGAWKSGVVEFAGDGGDKAGLMVQIRHDDGSVTKYQHLDNVNGADGRPLREGQRVQEGQRIGALGSTGNAAENDPHLHFQINVNGRAINPAEQGLMHNGAFGPRVEEVQRLLNQQLGTNLTVDGQYGQATTNAVKQWQDKHELPQTGVVDGNMLAAMRNPERYMGQGQQNPTQPTPSEPTSPNTPNAPTTPGQVPAGMYREGDSGDGVRALQEALRKNGAQIEADGRFGPRTEAAVMDFQTKNGLQADGIAGPQTIAKLNETLQQSQPAPAQPTPAQPNTPAPTTPAAPTGETPAPTNPQQPTPAPAQPNTPAPTTPTAPTGETPAPTNPQQPTPAPAQPNTPAPTTPTAPTGETPTPTNPQAPATPQPTAPAPAAPNAAALQGEGVLVEGARGQDVARLQQQLNNLGYTGPDGKPLQANGNFDAATTHAVKAFERDAGQTQDGIVGPRTTEALNKAEQSLVSNPSHPDNAMYQQAQKALQGVPPGTFANEQERNNAAAALTHEAKVSGMTQIDTVVANRSGSGLIAVQGGVEDPNSRRVYVDMDQAKTQPVRESSQLIQEAGQPAQNNQAPQRDNTQNQQANPQQVNPQQQMDQQNREQNEQTRTAPARAM